MKSVLDFQASGPPALGESGATIQHFAFTKLPSHGSLHASVPLLRVRWRGRTN